MALARRKTVPDFAKLRAGDGGASHLCARGAFRARARRHAQGAARGVSAARACTNSPTRMSPLPIAAEQTISQPYIVALMTEALALRGGEKVLEIGTGSGYAAAVLAEIAGEVYTVERIGQLAEKAATVLAEHGYDNVHVLHGDGTRGWPEHAPYDAIVVAAGGPKVPESLRAQLKIGGRLVIPVGSDARAQELVRVTRAARKRLSSAKTSPTCASCRCSARKAGSRRRRRRQPRRVVAAARRVAGAERSPTPPSRSTSIETADLGAAARPHRRRPRRAARRSLARHLRILPHARAHLARADPNARASTSSPSKATGRTPPASITMCAIANIRRRNGRPSPASRPGCGATTRCAPSSIGCAATMPASSRTTRVAFHGLDLYSLYTSIRSVLGISRRGRSGSPPRSRANAMAA